MFKVIQEESVDIRSNDWFFSNQILDNTLFFNQDSYIGYTCHPLNEIKFCEPFLLDAKMSSMFKKTGLNFEYMVRTFESDVMNSFFKLYTWVRNDAKKTLVEHNNLAYCIVQIGNEVPPHTDSLPTDYPYTLTYAVNLFKVKSTNEFYIEGSENSMPLFAENSYITRLFFQSRNRKHWTLKNDNSVFIYFIFGGAVPYEKKWLEQDLVINKIYEK